MKIRVGINGLGRIGRALTRQLTGRQDVVLAAANDLVPLRSLAHLIAHDSVYGPAPFPVRTTERGLAIGDDELRVTACGRPSDIPWEEEEVELVFEATGEFASRAQADAHLRGSVRQVVITATAPDADLTLLAGINDAALDQERHRVISAGSCTAQCLAPILQVLRSRWGIESAAMTTVHPYTNNQPLLDSGHSDLRRARAAGLSIVPATTSAILSILKLFPDMEGTLTGLSIRVPTPAISLIDLAAVLKGPAATPELRRAFRDAGSGPMRELLGTTEEELVSVDFRGETRAAVVDLSLTYCVSEKLVKVVAWYDNEWGYASRLLQTALVIARASEAVGADAARSERAGPVSRLAKLEG